MVEKKGRKNRTRENASEETCLKYCWKQWRKTFGFTVPYKQNVRQKSIGSEERQMRLLITSMRSRITGIETRKRTWVLSFIWVCSTILWTLSVTYSLIHTEIQQAYLFSNWPKNVTIVESEFHLIAVFLSLCFDVEKCLNSLEVGG